MKLRNWTPLLFSLAVAAIGWTIFATACSIAPPAVHRSALDDAPDMAPTVDPCAACPAGWVCTRSFDCVLPCGADACWEAQRAAWTMCGGF